MKKIVRKWIKEEKRIVKLLYRKGLLNYCIDNINELYWSSYVDHVKKTYLPEIYYSTKEYDGEYDEYSIVEISIDRILYKYDDSNEELKCLVNFCYKKDNRNLFITHLKSLPTIRNDHKINKILIKEEY